MMDYEAVRARQEAMRRSVERDRLAAQARRGQERDQEPRSALRLAAGAGLARLGMRLAGRRAIQAALGEAR